MCTEDWKPVSERPVIIQKDRFGRHNFIPVRSGLNDCCGFVNLMFGSLLIDGGKK